MKIDTKLKSIVIKILVAVCIITIFIQHQYVFMYFDDYGYGSLTYGFDTLTAPPGMDYTFKDILAFSWHHYLHWGGRQIPFIFEIICFKLGGIKLIQYVQAFIAVLIFGLMGLIASKITGIDLKTGMLISYISYGLISIGTLRDGIYWYTASVLYFWTMLPLLAGTCLLMNSEKDTGVPRRILQYICFFLAGYSQEQVAVMTFVLVWSYVIILKICKKISIKEVFGKTTIVPTIVISNIAALICIFAPGNFARAGNPMYEEWYAMPLYYRLIKNYAKILSCNLGTYNTGLVCCITIAFTIAIERILKKKQLAIGVIFVSLYILGFYKLYSTEDMKAVLFMTIIRTAWIVYYLGNILYITVIKKHYVLTSLLIGAICSQVFLLISPTLEYRSHIMFEIVMLLFFTVGIGYFIRDIDLTKVSEICLLSVLLVTCIYSIRNFAGIMHGYQMNYGANVRNDQILEEARADYKSGDMDMNATIVLEKLPAYGYSSMMPYYEEFGYINYWIHNYYELPYDIEIVWE